jgi:hypothetical protein
MPEPEAGDHLLGLGERFVDDRPAGTIERNTLALRGGLEAVGHAHDAGIAQLVERSFGRSALLYSELRNAISSAFCFTVSSILKRSL